MCNFAVCVLYTGPARALVGRVAWRKQGSMWYLPCVWYSGHRILPELFIDLVVLVMVGALNYLAAALVVAAAGRRRRKIQRAGS